MIYKSIGLELRLYIEDQTTKHAWEILKELYAKVGWVSHHLGLEALIDTHLGNSLKEYCTKYKATAERMKQLSEEIPCSNATCTRPTQNRITDTQITGIFLHNLGDYYQNFRDSKITPSRKENTPPTLNDLITELLSLNLYKEVFWGDIGIKKRKRRSTSSIQPSGRLTHSNWPQGSTTDGEN